MDIRNVIRQIDSIIAKTEGKLKLLKGMRTGMLMKLYPELPWHQDTQVPGYTPNAARAASRYRKEQTAAEQEATQQIN